MNDKPWDRFLLIAVAVLVIGLAGWFAVKAFAFKNQFPVETPSPDNTMPPVKTGQAKFATRYVETVNNWNLPKKGTPPKPLPLFVSIPIVEIDGGTIDMLSPDARQIRPPVSNGWLLAHDLDFLSKNVLAQDPDGDGYSNEEEWNGKTDPRSADSHPPYAEKIVLVERKAQMYRVMFAAKPDDRRFQIKRLASARWPKEDNSYPAMGELTDDKHIRIDAYEEKTAVNPIGINVDASVLSVTYMPQGSKHKLIRRIVEEIPTYYAELKFLLEPGKTFHVKEGDTFPLARDPGKKYRLIKVTPETATIAYETAPGQEQTIEIKKN